MLRDIFLGFIRVHILHHAAGEAVYGLALKKELARHGYRLSAGTLYPLLHGMEQAGYLRRRDETVDGKVRKYYLITAKGNQALAQVKRKISELVVEVMEGDGA